MDSNNNQNDELFVFTMEPGTKYTFEMPDGSQSEKHTFTEKIPARLVSWEDTVHIYQLKSGLTVYILVEDYGGFDKWNKEE